MERLLRLSPHTKQARPKFIQLSPVSPILPVHAADKPIHLSRPAVDRLESRGATPVEVTQAIRQAAWHPTERGRLECHVNFSFDRTWRGKEYLVKQVRPIFVDEPDGIVVVTVYVYYF